MDAEGQQADWEQIRALGMAKTVLLKTSRGLPNAEIHRLTQCGTALIGTKLGSNVKPHTVDTEIICCKYARGKIRFTAGEWSSDLEFEGWARLLKPPPFVCPHTRESTFHIGTTDDGRIAAANAIETCDQTRRRVLSEDLRTCSVTGRRALVDLMEKCPVCGEFVLRSEMVDCQTCGEQVSPAVLAHGDCGACRGLEAIAHDDPRLVRIRECTKVPESWTRWRLSETATVYVLKTGKLLRRFLMVVDKQTLQLKRLATGNPFGTAWKVVPPAEYAHLFGQQ
jgi:hypothetical protein